MGPEFVRFGEFELNLSEETLKRSGVLVKLPAQPSKLLTLLARRPGQLVTHQQIQAELWKGETFVDFQQGMHRCIRQIRAALGDDADIPRFIETVPRRGYRFIAGNGAAASSIDATGQGTSEQAALGAPADRSTLRLKPGDHRFRLLALALLLLAVGASVLAVSRFWHPRGTHSIRSLAVLPLENLSGDAGQDYFVDGMTDELTTHLSKIRSLRVVSRTSADRYKKTQKSLGEIARELDVDAIVEGSVTRSGSQVRIRAQLIDVSRDQHLWAETYTADLPELLSVQAEIARSIARQIRVELTPQQERAIAGSTRAPNPAAYEAYLKGRYFFAQGTYDGFRKSCDYFREVMKADPAYALGYSAMADCFSAMSSSALMPAEQAMPQAEAMARKAIELDDSLAEAHGAMGTVLLNYEWNWPAAYAELQKAEDLDPNDLETHLRMHSYYRVVGRIDDAVRELKLAQKLDPVSMRPYARLGWLYIYAGRYDEAEAGLKKCLEFNPDYPYGHYGLFVVYDHRRAFAQAIAELRQYLMLTRWNQEAERVGELYRSSGYEKAKRQFYEQGLARDLSDPSNAFALAEDYASVGDKEKTVDYLEKAYRQRSSMMIQLKVHSYFDGVRSEPRFQRLLKNMRLDN